METHDHIRSQRLKRAENEDVLTALLHRLLTTPSSGAVGTSPPGVDLLRSLLSCNGRVAVPVLDLVAVLPDADVRELIGLHIASYYGRDARDRWYWTLLEKFFASGRGSLLALEDFNRHVGQCHFFCLPAEHASGKGASHPVRKHLLTERMPFSPQQQKHKVTMKDRFSEYAGPVLAQFDKPAALAWICFGPNENRKKGALRWGGSLFAVISSDDAKDLHSPDVSNAIDYVYGILNASFYRTIVDRSRQEEEAHRLRLTYFAFGHDLKNRIERIEDSSVISLRTKLQKKMPELLPDIDQCHALLQVLAGMCGVFSAVAKVKEGLLPGEWIGCLPDEYKPTKARRDALSRALVAAVAAFTHVEDSVDASQQRLELRQVHNGGTRRIKRPAAFRAIELPPFNPDNAEPHLCFLSGLAELCRNAARFVLDTPRIGMKRPHVDFSVTVTEKLVATVTIHNPVVGEFKHSKSIGLLAQLFRDFGDKVVRIEPAKPVSYAHGLKGCKYVRSRFVYSPMHLTFEE